MVAKLSELSQNEVYLKMSVGELSFGSKETEMGLADACLVRMTETLADPIILTTDQDFRVYRRHSRQVVPCVTPK